MLKHFPSKDAVFIYVYFVTLQERNSSSESIWIHYQEIFIFIISSMTFTRFPMFNFIFMGKKIFRNFQLQKKRVKVKRNVSKLNYTYMLNTWFLFKIL